MAWDGGAAWTEAATRLLATVAGDARAVHVTVVAGAGYARLAANWARTLAGNDDGGGATPAYVVACLDATACSELRALGLRARTLPFTDVAVQPPVFDPVDAAEPGWTGAPPAATAVLSRSGSFWWRATLWVTGLPPPQDAKSPMW